eukprot:355648-Pyramimonas_sp.AAC.1
MDESVPRGRSGGAHLHRPRAPQRQRYRLGGTPPRANHTISQHNITTQHPVADAIADDGVGVSSTFALLTAMGQLGKARAEAWLHLGLRVAG